MSSTIRVMHAGDLSLDRQFPLQLCQDADERYLYQDASLKACEKLVFLCIQENVDVLLITGKLFADDRPTLRACLALQEMCQELLKSGVEVVFAGPDQGLCELADVSAFIPAKVQYIPIKQPGVWRREFAQGQQLQIGYRISGSSSQGVWQVGLLTMQDGSEQPLQDDRIMYAIVGDHHAELSTNNYSEPAPLQPVEFFQQGRPFIHLLETTGHGWEIHKFQTAVIELRKRRLEVIQQATWDQILNQLESLLVQEDHEGLEQVVYHWKLIGHGDLLESLLDDVKSKNLIEDLQKISPVYPRCVHAISVVPVRKYSGRDEEQLEEIYHAAMFGEVNTIGSSEPFTLPGLSGNMEDFVHQVVEVDLHQLDESDLFEEALRKGHAWLR